MRWCEALLNVRTDGPKTGSELTDFEAESAPRVGLVWARWRPKRLREASNDSVQAMAGRAKHDATSRASLQSSYLSFD